MSKAYQRLLICLLLAGATVVSPPGGDAAEGLVVHEWGTFTALQDEQGRELPGINIDDEPVPKFVHNLNPFLLNAPLLSSSHWMYRQKATPRQHPMVTMRLETPVIYFYPHHQTKPMTVDVSVQFRGGWLTEFYPWAQADAPGLKTGAFEFGELTPETIGSLAWNGLQVGTDGQGPQTDAHVWNAPRQVSAVQVTTDGGSESEKYLFYRGVGNLRAPLRVTLGRPQRQLTIHGNFDAVLREPEIVRMNALWLVHVRDNGTLAFRDVAPIDVSADTQSPLASMSYAFAEGEYAVENLAKLKLSMRQSLIVEGLFPDEADAMLATWQRAYFVSPGLRLFFLVPRPWTQQYLPLTISRAAQINRVMVGRIELVSDEQRARLDRLAQVHISDGRWLETIAESPAREGFLSGRTDFGDLGVTVPEDYQLYLSLGRFRNALIVAEQHRRPTPSLNRFIEIYQLQPYQFTAADATAPEAQDQ